MITALLLAATLTVPNGKPVHQHHAQAVKADTVREIDYLKRVDDAVWKEIRKNDVDEDQTLFIEHEHLRCKNARYGSHIHPTYFVTELNPLRDWV